MNKRGGFFFCYYELNCFESPDLALSGVKTLIYIILLNEERSGYPETHSGASAGERNGISGEENSDWTN